MSRKAYHARRRTTIQIADGQTDHVRVLSRVFYYVSMPKTCTLLLLHYRRSATTTTTTTTLQYQKGHGAAKLCQ